MEKNRVHNPSGDFAGQVEAVSRSGVNRCWQCRSCTNGCPLAQDMDVFPDAVIRMVQLGLKKQVLESAAIWLCVGCDTCSAQCPNAIDVAAVMDALRQIAVQENADIAEPGILSFHRAVLDSIFRHGRTHKLEIMMRYKLAEKDLLSDAELGLRMLAKRKLDLLPSKVKNIRSIRSLFGEIGGDRRHG